MIEFKPEIGMRTYIDEQLEQFGFQFNNGLEPIPVGVIGAASLDTDSAQKPERTRST
ncbi:hypothetical protein [Salmonella enterica]|uniref:hypothetical protein n=1 Tax=Salmonella enterica TaxID=28901 RepID=UPI0016022B26|nr:hypothetical protein [Salmonella enterica]